MRPLRAVGNTGDGVVADVVEFLRERQLRRPILVGVSIGAAFATEVALAYPDLVGGVVAVDGPSYWFGQGTFLSDIVDDMRYRRADFLSRWVPDWFAPDTNSVLVDWTIRQILDSGVHIDQQFHDFARYDPRPRLSQLRTPIHYVHGELDSQIPVEVARVSAACTPGAEVTVIEGAGHMPPMEKAAEFTAALRGVVDAFARTVADGAAVGAP